MAILTFLDSSVLFAAHRGDPAVRVSALALVNDAARSFIASPFLCLETMPKAVYYRNTLEIEFYRTYFDNIRIWISDVEQIIGVAQEESERCGLGAMDALHVAAAHIAGAEVFYTLERSEKAIHRSSLVQVLQLIPNRSP